MVRIGFFAGRPVLIRSRAAGEKPSAALTWASSVFQYYSSI
jgi:hypothetical protein